MAQQLYIRANGQVTGPFLSREIKHMALSGQLLPEHELCLTNGRKWVPASKVPDLVFLNPATSPAEEHTHASYSDAPPSVAYDAAVSAYPLPPPLPQVGDSPSSLIGYPAPPPLPVQPNSVRSNFAPPSAPVVPSPYITVVPQYEQHRQINQAPDYSVVLVKYLLTGLFLVVCAGFLIFVIPTRPNTSPLSNLRYMVGPIIVAIAMHKSKKPS